MICEHSNHEEQFVRAFLVKQNQERALFLLRDPKRRYKFTEKLAHFNDFDPRFAKTISPKVAHTAIELVSLLRSKGAPNTVHIISEVRSLDGTALELTEAMHEVCGHQAGTILSCIPGKLAFFRGEAMKSELLLERPPTL